jgi:hypothetical protein
MDSFHYHISRGLGLVEHLIRWHLRPGLNAIDSHFRVLVGTFDGFMLRARVPYSLDFLAWQFYYPMHDANDVLNSCTAVDQAAGR